MIDILGAARSPAPGPARPDHRGRADPPPADAGVAGRHTRYHHDEAATTANTGRGASYTGRGAAYTGRGAAYTGRGAAYTGRGAAYTGRGAAYTGRGAA